MGVVVGGGVVGGGVVGGGVVGGAVVNLGREGLGGVGRTSLSVELSSLLKNKSYVKMILGNLQIRQQT